MARGARRTLAVGHAGEGTGEEFEGALARLLRGVHLANVENVEQAARECDDEAVADGVHEVDAFGERVRGLLLRGGSAGVPETDGAIPGAGNDSVCKKTRRRNVRSDWRVGRIEDRG